jgi:hypothetical protein
LAIVLAAGLVFMRRTDPHLRPLPKAVPPAHEVSAPHVHVKPEHSSATAHEEAAPSATASAKPAAATGHAGASSVTAVKPASSATGAAPVAAPDAGWVKPAWAIPDDEPHRAHDDDSRDAGK